MKKIITCVILLLLSSILFAQSATDTKKVDAKEQFTLPAKYQTVKVTLNEKNITVEDLLLKMSKETGIKFIAGEDDDWRVKERKLSAFSNDNAYLEATMASIANTCKFMWVSIDENTYMLKYRPDLDSYISSLDKVVATAKAAEREAILDSLFPTTSSNENMDDLRNNDPLKYLFKTTGLDTTIGGAIEKIPGLKTALVNGDKKIISGTDISDEAINYINLSTDIVKKNVEESMKKRKEKVPTEMMGYLEPLPTDKSRIVVEVNNDYGMGAMPPSMDSIIMGYALIKVDGKVVGGIPVINNKSSLVQKFSKVAVELWENPELSPEQAYASAMGPDMMADFNKDMRSSDTTFKMPLPTDPFLATEIKLEKQPKTMLETMEMFAKATECPVFCDDFPSTMDKMMFNTTSVKTQGTVYDILNSIVDTYGLNVEFINGQFNFYQVRWFDYIKKLMPQAIITRWENEYKTTGFLSIDTIMEMARYTNSQLSSAYIQKPVFNQLIQEVMPNYNMLYFASMLTKTDYGNMMSDRGLLSNRLPEYSFNNLRNVYQVAGKLATTTVIIKCKEEKTDTLQTITYTLIPQDGSKEIVISVKIPKCNDKDMIK